VSLSLVELKQVIELSDFDKVLGEIEGQCLDAKEQPYRFEDGSDIKREFAKDVSAFANSRGGAILVGLRTKTGPFQYGEEVEIIRPIPVAFFDPDQHRKILAEWLYPQPIGIEIVFKPFGNDPNKGVGVIFVPPQDDLTKPFLIKRVIGETKKTSELLIGFVERRVDGTEVRTVADLHHALKIGLNLERELLGRISNLEAKVDRHFSAKAAAESLEEREKRLEDRIRRLLNEARAGK
jgi:hypothetical protein